MMSPKILALTVILAIGTTGIATPALATSPEEVCRQARELVDDRRKMVRSDIRSLRQTIRSGALTGADKREARRELVTLRSRRQLLKVATRRFDAFPTARQCQHIEAFSARVASYSGGFT